MEGGWAKLLQPVSLTSSGRPLLLPGEVECQLVDKVDLEMEQHNRSPSMAAPPLRSGLLTLTTFRILWVDQQARRGGSIFLGCISQVFPPKKTIKTMFGSTARLRLQVSTTSDGVPAFPGPKFASSYVYLSLALKGQTSPETVFSKLNEVLRARAWETSLPQNTLVTSPSEPAPPIPSGPSSSVGPSRFRADMAGVSGILRKEQELWEETDKNLHEAFQDLNALMKKAHEMVTLAEKMRAKLLAPSVGQSSAGDEEDMGSKQEMEDWLLSVGITSPVTKETAGALYHQQLSRQLADFVKLPLEKAGGMLAMVDAYCLFNRARGTELISPEDLLQACTIWEKLDVPVRLRRFDSGVMVIQSRSHSDEEVFAKITTLVAKAEMMKLGINASDAARSLGVTPALAKEHLLAAESKGLVCRDDSPDGLRFFFNFFKEIALL